MNTRVLIAVAASAVLSACGGGGGGGGNDTSPPPFRIQIQQTSVDLQYREGNAPTSTTLTATWQGDPPSTLYLGATVEGSGIQTPIAIAINTAAATATATVIAASRPAGDYTGRIVFMACTNSQCSQTVGGSPLPVPYTVRVTDPVFRVSGSTSTSAISVSHLIGTNASVHTLNVSAGAGAWTATATRPWITLSQTSGNGATAVALSYNPALMTSGSNSGSVTFNSALGAQTLIYTVQVSAPVVSVNNFPLFQGVAGSELQNSTNATVSLTGGAVLPMTVTADRTWIQISQAAPTGPGGFTVSLGPDARSLPSGTHTGTVRVHLEGGLTDVDTSVNVQLTLERPVLTVSPATVVLGGNVGRDFSSVPVTLSLNTGSVAHTLMVSSPPSWFSLDQSSGPIDQNGRVVTVTPNRAQATPGTIASTLTFSTTVNGESTTRTIPVEFNLDTHRIIASEPGVALVDLPGADRDSLSRTVKVRDNFGLNTPWTASDDASWLTVTPSGTHNGDLVLTADTTGLTADRLYEANVRIQTTDPTIIADEYVRVGLWVGTGVPTQMRWMPIGVSNAVGDPIRPYMYGHDPLEMEIRIINLYTNEELAPITGIPAEVRDLKISQDGRMLFALVDSQTPARIVPIDLVTRTVGTPFLMPVNYQVRQTFQYIRPNGVGMLLDNRGGLYIPATNEWRDNGLYDFFVSGDQRYAFVALDRYEIDFTAARGGEFTRRAAGTLQVNNYYLHFTGAANFDGSRVFLCGRRTDVGSFDKLVVVNGLTLTGAVDLELDPGTCSSLAVTRRGQTVFTKIIYGDNDITIYNPDNTVALSGLDLGNSSPDEVSTTGDGNFAIIANRIVPIPR